MTEADMETTAVLGVYDYLVVAMLLLLSSSIGLYYRLTGGKQATLKVSKNIFCC
jgi:hypothetical protein